MFFYIKIGMKEHKNIQDNELNYSFAVFLQSFL